MWSGQALLCAVAVASTLTAVASEYTNAQSSQQILPDAFKPPPVFSNVNLLRTINLDKGYARETVNVVIQNDDNEPQSHYYVPFVGDVFGRVGGFQVRDKKAPELPPFVTEAVEFDSRSSTQFYRVTLPSPLAPSQQQTLSISYHVLFTYTPLPASIGQKDKQYLVYDFSLYAASAYPTKNQKTKLKLPTADVPDFTGEPERQGSTFTYGPFADKPAGAQEAASVRYEYTKPIVHASLLERDVEISHWGGNMAVEERYWLTNLGAELAQQFSRVQWTMSQHYPTASNALSSLKFPLQTGSTDAYFVDDIGNVSTSRFRKTLRESHLELKPRYPIFGAWKYSFKIGWNNDLSGFLRRLKSGDSYVLKVPFLEGPKLNEGISYAKVQLRIILPEGATNVQYQCAVPTVSVEQGVHKTFMDTIGRSTLTLTSMNVIDQMREQDIVVTYDYSTRTILRKPLTIVAGLMTVFVLSWGIGSLDVSIGASK